MEAPADIYDSRKHRAKEHTGRDWTSEIQGNDGHSHEPKSTPPRRDLSSTIQLTRLTLCQPWMTAGPHWWPISRLSDQVAAAAATDTTWQFTQTALPCLTRSQASDSLIQSTDGNWRNASTCGKFHAHFLQISQRSVSWLPSQRLNLIGSDTLQRW